MSRPSTTLTEADISVEERSEAERHDRFYASQPSASLVMEPADWEKFESMDTPLCAYHASMLRLGDVRGLRVLDAGCGDGWHRAPAARARPPGAAWTHGKRTGACPSTRTFPSPPAP